MEGTIEPYIGDRLIIVFFGAAPGEQQGSNDVLIVTSDDNGDTWSEPKAVFPSGTSDTQSAKLLRLYKDKQGRLHLVWGRQIEGLPIPDEMWHSTSEDGGDTWTNPERFFSMEKPPGVSENGIIDYDVVSDSFGCIHWVANIYELRSSISTSMNEALGIYTRWCSMNKRWQTPEPLSELPGGVTFAPAVDEDAQKLYLFWTSEVGEGDQLAMFYSAKDLTEPVLPPEIAKSGRQIMQKDLGSKQSGLHTEEVNLEGLTSGTYIYEVELNNTWCQQSTMMLIK